MHTRLFIISLIWLFFGRVLHATAADNRPVLTNAAQIRNLSAGETSSRRPVRLTGVMMDTAKTATNWLAIILQDQTAGIYVLALPDAHGKNILAPFQRGDLLEITGVTGAGQFAPVVVAHAAKKFGTASIPEAQPATYQQLITGALDGQWVEIKGLIRQRFAPEPGASGSRIIIAVEGGLVQAIVTAPPNELQVDAEVKVRAICFYEFNQKRQVLSPVLQVPHDVPLLVEKPAPVDPYALPVRSPASLLTFSPENLKAYAHRIHIVGVVTYAEAGSFVWIRDGNSGLRIQTSQAGHLSPGDIIDALGFSAFGLNAPELEDAVWRQSGSMEAPAPITLANFDQAFEHEDDLVTATGTLTQIQPFLNGVAFTFDKDGQLFKAVLKIPSIQQSYPDWQVGSKVRITGICTVSHEDTQPMPGIWQPKSFQILMRLPADLIVLRSAPWWTPQHITILLGIATGILALMVGAIFILSRQRLRQQEHRRQMAEAEFAAILAERNRLAREIHDTLAQGLTATSVQLRLAKKQNGAVAADNRYLDAALLLVSDSLEEARNSIWNMRSHVLENGNLTDALKGILTQMTGGAEIITAFEVTGKPRQLAPVIENNLLRIGQEAITNAVKHAGAKQIKMTLEFGEKQFRLKVRDDGHGFDPENPPPSEGGFGLVGMRERAIELKGELTIRSTTGQGTEIILTLPLVRGSENRI